MFLKIGICIVIPTMMSCLLLGVSHFMTILRPVLAVSHPWVRPS